MRILFVSLLMCGTACAAPPAVGEANYAFADPVFSDVVFCDTLDQIKEIASAPDPNEVFKKYVALKNDTDESTCAAAAFYATVTSVESIGIMHE